MHVILSDLLMKMACCLLEYLYGQGTVYIGLQELSHADTDSVTKALLSLLEERYKLTEPDLKKKLAGFGSDGANVMKGKHAGVSAKLKEIVPGLVSVHCSAHKLALAASESATQVS